MILNRNEGPHRKSGRDYKVTAGRWPPNFCLVHTPNCEQVGTKRVKGHTGYPNGPKGWGFHGGIGDRSPDGTRVGESITGYADADGLETVSAWQCAEECAARRLGEQSGERKSCGVYKKEDDWKTTGRAMFGPGDSITRGQMNRYGGETGTAARFFPQFDWNAEVTERLENSDQVNYCAKVSRGERDAGLDKWELGPSFDKNTSKMIRRSDPDTGAVKEFEFKPSQRRNPHPTIKPIALAKWLATLLLPPSEYAPRRILIPFAGVMSEAIGAKLAGWEEIVGVEMSKEYCKIGEARMKFWSQFESREDGLKVAKQVKKKKEQIERLDHKVISLW